MGTINEGDWMTSIPAVLGGFDAYEPLLLTLKRLSVVVFLTTMMAGIGCQLSLTDVTRISKEYNLVLRWVLANVLAVPLFAILLGAAVRLSRPILLGLLLVAVSPGAPFIPTLARLSHEDSHEAVRMTATLTVVAVATAPLLTAGVVLLLEIEGSVRVLQLFVPLSLVLVAPLVAGGVIRVLTPAVAPSLSKLFDAVARVALLLALLLIVVITPGGTIQIFLDLFGTGALLVFVVFIAGSIGIGWAVGGPTVEAKRILALGTAGRNVGIALFIVANSFAGENADGGVLAFAILMVVVSILVAWFWGRRPNSVVPLSGTGEEATTER